MKRKRVIIVGGGTAGLTIVNRLQEICDVTVIEKSKYRKYPFYYGIPLLIGILFRKKTGSYVTRREFKLPDGRRLPFFQSNLWGGASVMNGCVHVFGFKSKWQKVLKRFNLDLTDLVGSYSELFSTDPKEKGKITIRLAHQNVVDRAFLDALASFGIPADDMSESEKESCGPIHNTIRRRLRTSVLNLLNRKRFKRVLDEEVLEIEFDDRGKVLGVVTRRGLQEADIVILAAGVLGSNTLLLKSKRSVPALKFDNLRIGEDLQDHTNLRVNVLATRPLGSLNETYASLQKKLALGFKHIMGKPTVMRGTGATSAAYLDLDGDGEVDTRLQILQFAETGRHASRGALFDTDRPSFSISINAIHPEALGRIFLEGEEAIVDPNFLSARRDIEILKLALKYCLELLNKNPIRGLVKEIIDEDLIQRDPEKYIVGNFYSGHHLIGGLQHAVQADFRVRSTEGLYVCDASIFDQYVASNIHSSVVLLADLFAKSLAMQHCEG